MYEEGFRWWRMGYAAAIAFVLFVVILAATLVQLTVQRGRTSREAHACGTVAALRGADRRARSLALVPLVWMVSASLMPTGEASAYPPRFFPSVPTFEHYRELFTRLDLGRYLFNSALIAPRSRVLSLLINSMAGYAFAKLRFAGRDRLFRAPARRAW